MYVDYCICMQINAFTVIINKGNVLEILNKLYRSHLVVIVNSNVEKQFKIAFTYRIMYANNEISGQLFQNINMNKSPENKFQFIKQQ